MIVPSPGYIVAHYMGEKKATNSGMTPSKLERLVVFEGIDGAGTTTQASILHDHLAKLGHRVWLTSEPTHGPIGLLLRDVLSNKTPLQPEVVAYLFAADRYEHAYGVDGIVAHHNAGQIIICDRYVYSSLAYQSVECDGALVGQLNSLVPIPEIVFFLALPVEVGEQRLSRRGEREIYEYDEFQALVSSNYAKALDVATQFTRVVTIDGTLDPDQVAKNAWEALAETSIVTT